MNATINENNAVYKNFFQRYFQEPDRAVRSVTSITNMRSLPVTNKQFLNALQTGGNFNVVKAEFSYFDSEDSGFTPDNTSYDAVGCAILIVRTDAIVTLYALNPAGYQGQTIIMKSLTPCAVDVSDVEIKSHSTIEANLYRMVLCILDTIVG